MPTYDYVCARCGHRFEVVHGVHADGPGTCAACGEGPVRKAFSAPSIHFKGSGWAKKDRTSKPAAAAASSGTTAGSASSAGGDSGSTDTRRSDGPVAPAATTPDTGTAGASTAGAGSKPTTGSGAVAAD